MQTATVIDISSAEISTEELRASDSTIIGHFLFYKALFIIIFVSRDIFVIFHDNIDDIIGNIKLILNTNFTCNRRHTPVI